MFNKSLLGPMCTIVCIHLHAHLSAFRRAVNSAPQTSRLTTGFSLLGWGGSVGESPPTSQKFANSLLAGKIVPPSSSPQTKFLFT